MTEHTIWDGTNDNIHTNNNEDLGFNHHCEPWKNMTKLVKTVTASIRAIQNIYRKKHQSPLNREDFC